MARMTNSPYPRIKPESKILPNSSDLIPEPWDIADGHANVPEDMGSGKGLDAPDPHQTHIANHSVARYNSYIDEEVRNPADAS